MKENVNKEERNRLKGNVNKEERNRLKEKCE